MIEHIGTIRSALEHKKRSILYLSHYLTTNEAQEIVARIDAALAWLDTLTPAAGADGLLPCPFCGGPAIVVYSVLAWEARCIDKRCPGRTSVDHDTWEAARAAWNRRTLLQPPAPQETIPKPVLDAIELMLIDWDDRFDAGDWQWVEKWIVKEWFEQQRIAELEAQPPAPQMEAQRIAELESELETVSQDAMYQHDELMKAQARIAELKAALAATQT